MKQFLYLIFSTVVFGFGFHAGKQKTVIPSADKAPHEQISQSSEQIGMSGINAEAKDNVFQKHNTMSKSFTAPSAFFATDREQESQVLPLSPEMSEELSIADIREQEELHDEILEAFKNNGMSEEDIQMLAGFLDSTLTDSAIEDSSDLNADFSEQQSQDAFLAILRSAGWSEEQINALEESQSSIIDNNGAE